MPDLPIVPALPVVDSSPCLIRPALTLVSALVLLGANVPSAHGQAAPGQKRGVEFLVSTGRVLPTGALRNAIASGNLTAAQLSWRLRPSLALTGTFGWARTRDITDAARPKVDLFTYDLGAELRAPTWGSASGVSLRPFAGIGAGARSYDYRKGDTRATHNLAAYGSAGGEVGVGRVHLRMELRDYVAGFKALNGVGTSATRNDLVLLAGLRLVRR